MKRVLSLVVTVLLSACGNTPPQSAPAESLEAISQPILSQDEARALLRDKLLEGCRAPPSRALALAVSEEALVLPANSSSQFQAAFKLATSPSHPELNVSATLENRPLTARVHGSRLVSGDLISNVFLLCSAAES